MMRNKLVVGAAAIALTVFCAGAMASSSGSPPDNTPKALKAFSHVRLTVVARKKAVALQSEHFTVRLHNPTGRTFHNVQLILGGMRDQSGHVLANTGWIPDTSVPGFRIRFAENYYFWYVYSLRPGATKSFDLTFGIRKEKGTKKICLKIVSLIFSPASVIPSTHRAKGCAAYHRH